jgi:hypothetical protein
MSIADTSKNLFIDQPINEFDDKLSQFVGVEIVGTRKLANDSVAGTSSAGSFFLQNLFVDQIVDVANGCVFRAFCNFSPFGRGELPLKAVE